MNLSFVGANNPMWRPGVHKVGVVGEMVTGINMPILSGDDHVVTIVVGWDIRRDPLGAGIATRDSQSASLAEGRLDVHDEKGTAVSYTHLTLPTILRV